MISIYICEDNKRQAETFSHMISTYLAFEEFNMTLSLVTDDPYELLKKSKQNKNTGLYFLDIELQSDMVV